MKRSRFLSLLVTLGLGTFSALNSAASDFPKGSPTFVTGYDAALKAAKTSGKPIIAIFSASWCPPCQANKQNVYPSSEVKPFHEKFVWAYLDADEEANVPAMKKFGVSGIPHIQFLDAKGASVGKLIGGSSPKAFRKELESILKKTSAGE